MDRQSLLYVSAGIAVLALLVVVLTYAGGGLNPQTQAGLATAEQLLKNSRANYGELSRETRSLIDSMTGLPQSRREQWLTRLDQSEKDLESASSELEQAAELAARDDDELRVEIERRIDQSRQEADPGVAGHQRDTGCGQDRQRGGQESRPLRGGGPSCLSPNRRLPPRQHRRRSESHDRLAREKRRLEPGHPTDG